MSDMKKTKTKKKEKEKEMNLKMKMKTWQKRCWIGKEGEPLSIVITCYFCL
jgi:hypothetical protein